MWTCFVEGATCAEYIPARDRIKFTDQVLKDLGRKGVSPIQQFKSSATISLDLSENWIILQGDWHLQSSWLSRVDQVCPLLQDQNNLISPFQVTLCLIINDIQATHSTSVD